MDININDVEKHLTVKREYRQASTGVWNLCTWPSMANGGLTITGH